MLALWWALACGDGDAWIVEGVVVEVRPPAEVVIDHQEVKGLMGPMTMPFQVRDAALLRDLEPGDRVVARLITAPDGSFLERIRETGRGPVPEKALAPLPLQPGDALAPVTVTLEDGSTAVVGAGQGQPTALAFLYTQCPIPEFCPALVSRIQALSPEIVGRARVITVTLDPEHDTPEVLAAFARTSGADPQVWRLGRVDPEPLAQLAGLAAMSVDRSGGSIEHGARLLVLDAEGRLIERYDDNRFPLDRVVSQLTTGGPPAPPGMNGTVSP